MNWYSTFIKSVRWNLIESLIYQSLLLAHQWGLFYATNPRFYGLIGILYATVYFFAVLANSGLEYSFAPFFTQAQQSKQSFKRLVLWQLYFQNIISLIGILAIILYAPSWLIKQSQQSIVFGILLASIILLEANKKNLKMILNLAFLSKYVAHIEIMGMINYVMLFWGSYWYTGTITLEKIFIPLFWYSILTTSLFAFKLYKFYKKLPNNTFNTTPLPKSWAKRLFFIRIYNAGNSLYHAFFSSNFLITLIGSSFGYTYAGIYKLISTTAQIIASAMHKIFGFSSSALFALLKNSSEQIKNQALIFTSQLLWYSSIVLSVLLMIGSGIGSNVLSLSVPISYVTITLFVLVVLSENIFLVHEIFYIAEEKIFYGIFLQAISASLLAGVVYYITTKSLNYIFFSILIIRLCSCIVLRFIQKKN